MLLSFVKTFVLKKRWSQVNLINGDLTKTKGKKLFIQIGEHKFNDIKGRFSTELFNGKRINTLTEAGFRKMEADETTYPSLRHAIEASKKGSYVFCYNAPLLIVVANRKDYGNNIADCACALENMMVAANALDLGSCWINQLKWLNEDPELLGVFRGFGMREDERIYGAVILGTPATETGMPNRNRMAMKGNEVTWID